MAREVEKTVTRSSDIYIQATETDPEVAAAGEIREIHQRLRARLNVAIGPEPAAGQADPVEFCRGELRQYLSAARETLWAPAAGAAGTRLLTRAGNAGLTWLDASIDALATADAGEVAARAQAISGALELYLAIEEDVLLPALAELPGADLATLAADLRTVLDDGQVDTPAVIDVREIPHGQRHPRIFARFARLAARENFMLVNNHDPKPLRREFEAAFPGAFSWEYVQAGPDEWQVRIGRVAEDA